MKKINSKSKILCFLLAFVMMLGVFPMNAFASDFDSDWDDFNNSYADESDFSSSDTTLDFPSKEIEENYDTNTDTTESTENTADLENKNTEEKPEQMALGMSGNPQLLPWASNLNQMMQQPQLFKNATGVSGSPLTWSGGNITFGGGTYFVGSGYLYRLTHSDGDAFCAEFNGIVAGGTYAKQGEGTSQKIKQVIANFEDSGKSSNDYITAQCLIWAELLGTSVQWGGFSPSSAITGSAGDTTNLTYFLHKNTDTPHTQNIFTWEDEETTIPDEPEDSNTRIEVEVEVETKVETFNEKTFEYSDAIGQITIRKHDQDGLSLDGALFDIRVDFTDGSHILVQNWEVDNGARLFTWTHPDNNYDPATVTITEVQPPRYYEGDPTPQIAIVHPTYTRVTIVKQWTTTHWTYFYHYTVFEISSDGDETVVDTYDIRDEEFDVSTPVIESFPDFVEGDRETTVTFVNRRITGDIIVTKKDANTGQVLAGASIHLWGDDLGEARLIDKTIVTGADGQAVFSDLPPGTYVIQETQAPFGYNLNNDKQTAVLQSGETIYKEVANFRKNGLIIKKVDQDGKAVAGAVFELRRGSGEVLHTEVTNENGIIFRDYLVEGTYVIEEIKAPEGYLLDENPIKTIHIYESDDNKMYTVTFVNLKKPSIEVIKVDSETPTLKLEGAVFRVTNSRTGQYWDIQTGADGTARLEDLEINTTYIVEEIVAPNGYINSGYREEIVLRECRTHTITVKNDKTPTLTILKIDEKTSAPLVNAVFRITYDDGRSYMDATTGADGKAHLTGLPIGWVSIEEIKAPDGYLLLGEPVRKYLSAGDNEITLTNTAVPFLKIVKEDSHTGTRIPNTTFKITQKTDTGEKLIGEFTTDENGEILLEVEPSRYLIEETKPANGYIKSDEIKEVTIEYGTTVVTFFNAPENPIYISKVDVDGKPIPNTYFSVRKVSGEFVREFKTAKSGYAIVPAEPDFYIIEEVRSADGFILNSKPQIVHLKADGKPVTVKFVNDRIPRFELLKLDASTKEPVMGARFKITTTDGSLIGEFDTDIHGRIFLEGIKEDTKAIVVTEIRSADGYILDNTPHTVQLKANECVTLTVYNKPLAGLQIRKIDSVTLLPVSDCVFNVQKLENGARRDLGNFTSGENGLIYIPNLDESHLEITEIKAKEGYKLDPTPKTVFVESGKLNIVEFRNQPYSGLKIVKVSADDATKTLEGAVFRVYDERRIEIGTYNVNESGEIVIENLLNEYVYIQEVKAPTGYVLDGTVKKVELNAGKTVTIQVKNTPMGSFRLVKKDAVTGKTLSGVTFLIYDAKNNIIGEFVTDQNGLIELPSTLEPQKIKIKEIATIDGYILSKEVITSEIKSGETTEIVVENEPERGKFQITKVSSAKNEITKDKENKGLAKVEFEIYNNQMELVDTITTDKKGLATSIDLPLGVYGIKEIKSADYYFTDGEMFYAEIKIHKDLVKFTVKNDPVDISVTIEKRGNAEVQAGDNMYYEFSNIANTSNVPLEEFYIHDVLPTDAVRLEKIWTGTWSERSKMEVQIKTNLKSNYRTVKKDLLSTNNNEIDCSPSALGLASNEYITEFKIVFKQEVGVGFHNTSNPKIEVKVMDKPTKENTGSTYAFTNKVDVGGRYLTEWTYTTDGWTTITWYVPKGDLPRTGLDTYK